MTSTNTSNYIYQRLEHMLMMVITRIIIYLCKCYKRRGRGTACSFAFFAFQAFFFSLVLFINVCCYMYMFVICTYVLLIYVPPIIGQCGFRFLTLNFYPQSYIFLLCHIVCIVNIYTYVCKVELNHYHYIDTNLDAIHL